MTTPIQKAESAYFRPLDDWPPVGIDRDPSIDPQLFSGLIQPVATLIRFTSARTGFAPARLLYSWLRSEDGQLQPKPDVTLP